MSMFEARFLHPADLPALLELERSKWESHQAADAEMLRQRMPLPLLQLLPALVLPPTRRAKACSPGFV